MTFFGKSFQTQTIKKWVRLYRHQSVDIIINTSNGVERQNKTLKHEYLTLHKDKSLSGVVSVIKNNYLPDLLKKYTLENAKMSSEMKNYNSNIDRFLHDRPTKMIQHVMDRKDRALQYNREEINQLGLGQFMVKSHSKNISKF